jgi:O-methyltransferase domain
VTPFEHFRAHPEVGRLFDEAMSGFVTQNGVAVAEVYDFGSFSRIVDVGGGDGTLAISILRAHAGIRAVVFDLPDVIATARKRVESAGLTARCEFVAGSFFESIPASADAYLLASIIHDREEERCREILARCREATPPHAKLLLLEMVILRGDDPFFGKLLDLEMLACFGGRERSAQGYRELLARRGVRAHEDRRDAHADERHRGGPALSQRSRNPASTSGSISLKFCSDHTLPRGPIGRACTTE